MSFIEPCRLHGLFERMLGKRCDAAIPDYVWFPRGRTAVWLPNNVSLLGPLTLVLLSLVGAPVGLKMGSRSDDLSSALLAYCSDQLPAGALRDFLRDQVEVHSFARKSTEAEQLSRWAQTRIVFGSNIAAEAIDALPHDIGSQMIAFVDRQSEVWLSDCSVDETVLRDLIAVFSVYGRLGCTSPRRIVLLEGGADEAERLAHRLASLWKQVVRSDAEAHVASGTLLSSQWARALGHSSLRVAGGHATLVWGHTEECMVGGNEVLSILPSRVGKRFSELPGNIQTIGHAFSEAQLLDILPHFAKAPAVRLVPIAQMHHFSPVWDGEEFWRRLFQVKEIRK